MCTAFSILQNLNYDSKNTEEVKKLFKRAIKHIMFTVHLCELQIDAGRYFVFEHPKSAKSWQLACMKKLADMQGVIRINIDMCMFGMVSTMEDMQVAPAKKPTGLLTNSHRIARRMLKGAHAKGKHVHASLIGGRAKACEIYPKDFCMQLCLGLRYQLDKDRESRRIAGGSDVSAVFAKLVEEEAIRHEYSSMAHIFSMERHLSSHARLPQSDGYPSPHDEEDVLAECYEDAECVDEVTGNYLDKGLAIKARIAEMQLFRNMGVYIKVDRNSINGKIISTKWIDVNKGDDNHPDYRARLVGREIKRDQRLDLFAPTSPIESLKYIASKCANNRHKHFKIMTNDIKRAYFYGTAKREIYFEIPEEDRQPGDEHKVGKLNLSFYGTRDATQNLSEEVSKAMETIGFRKGLNSACNFYHAKRNISSIVHGDDST